MLNRIMITTALASTIGVGVAAQQPQPQPQPQPRPQAERPAPAAAQQATTTITGCVYRERDVPGRAPNVAERVGILEDYILVSSNMPAAGNRAPDAASATGTRGAGAASPAGTSGTTGAMYKLEFVDDERLQALVGKRVEAMGRIDAEEGDSRAPAAGEKTSTTEKIVGRDDVDLSEFEVSTIKEVAGTCPAAPGAK